MKKESQDFLTAVLGIDGASALRKATEKSEALESVLVPRTILAWIGISARLQYEGAIPGYNNSYISFKKSENGYTGAVSMSANDVYDFNEVSLYHVAASMAVSMGIDHDHAPANLKDLELTRLGKNIDLLVKARVVTEQMKLQKKTLDPSLGYKFHHETESFHDAGGAHHLTTVHAFTPTGEKVGEVEFIHRPHGLESTGTTVHPKHQRLGIASAMYAHVQKQTGLKVIPSDTQTPAGKGLWAGNASTPQFGKAEFAEPSSKLTSDHGYLYHATSAENLDDISSSGLNAHLPHEFTDQDTWPDGADEPRVYFSPQAHMVWHFAPDHGRPVVLRIHQQHLEPKTEKGTGDVFSRKPVPPDNLEIMHADGSWKPLKASMTKTELPGQTAKPTQAAGALEADPPSKQAGNPKRAERQKGRSMAPPPPKSSIPGLPKLPKLKLSEKQLNGSCPACGGKHMRNEKFVGCMCFRDLAPSVTLAKHEDASYTLVFGKAWDSDAIETLLEGMRK